MKELFYRIVGRLTFSRLQLWRFLPDKFYLQVAFHHKLHKHLNLKNPQTFNEKLQWLKLYDRRPEYTKMVDKYEVKEYVSKIIGSQYIIPTLGVWNQVSEIDWDNLPNEFVLKCTHDSGGLVICRDKNKIDKEAVMQKLQKHLRRNFWKYGREWPYKNVRPRIIAETLLKDVHYPKELPDYKWFCFDGEPKFCQVIQNRNTEETIDFFDLEWNHQEFIGLNLKAEPAPTTPKRPSNLGIQIEIAKKLANGIPFSRIDLYEVNNKEFFGEITLYPASGFGEFFPRKYNEILGKMVSLPGIRGDF